MNLSNYWEGITLIKQEMIFVDVPIDEKIKAIEYLVSKAKEMGLVTEKGPLVEAVKEREKLVSTNLELNIAIPHGKSSVVKEPFISYLSTTESFQWDEGESSFVQYVFLIGVPVDGGNKTHLKYISEVSKKLIDEDFRRELFGSKTSEEAYELLKSINEKIEIIN
jgi:fructose PTS system EIIA component